MCEELTETGERLREERQRVRDRGQREERTDREIESRPATRGARRARALSYLRRRLLVGNYCHRCWCRSYTCARGRRGGGRHLGGCHHHGHARSGARRAHHPTLYTYIHTYSRRRKRERVAFCLSLAPIVGGYVRVRNTANWLSRRERGIYSYRCFGDASVQ